MAFSVTVLSFTDFHQFAFLWLRSLGTQNDWKLIETYKLEIPESYAKTQNDIKCSRDWHQQKPVKNDELHISGSQTMEEFVSIHSSLESGSDSRCTNEAFSRWCERKNTLKWRAVQALGKINQFLKFFFYCRYLCHQTHLNGANCFFSHVHSLDWQNGNQEGERKRCRNKFYN